jgi:hypothetical protein
LLDGYNLGWSSFKIIELVIGSNNEFEYKSEYFHDAGFYCEQAPHWCGGTNSC